MDGLSAKGVTARLCFHEFKTKEKGAHLKRGGARLRFEQRAGGIVRVDSYTRQVHGRVHSSAPISEVVAPPQLRLQRLPSTVSMAQSAPHTERAQSQLRTVSFAQSARHAQRSPRAFGAGRECAPVG